MKLNNISNKIWKLSNKKLFAAAAAILVSGIAPIFIASSASAAPIFTPPTERNQCWGNGFKNFKNQNFATMHDCVEYVMTHSGSPVSGILHYDAYGLNRRAAFEVGGANGGWFNYSDVDGQWYKTVVSSNNVNIVSENKAFFAARVTSASNPSWDTNWVIVEVQKGPSDVNPDFVKNNGPNVSNSGNIIWGSFTDKATAISDEQNAVNPNDGPFTQFSRDVNFGFLKIRDNNTDL